MKKIILGLLILNVFAGYSQAITVNTTTSATTLVNTIFNGTATNISGSSGNGIGSFQNTNSVFPLSSGVVIHTGIANGITTSVLGGTLSTTNNNLSDSDLQAFSNANGFTGTIYDSSFLSFNFVATSSSLSLDYVFASEEYGTYQCDFSDPVAFLLTDLTTGVTTNIAVVPQTTTPVTVASIRDNAYNANCPSVNPQYFGTFDNINNASIYGTCFNGHTVLLNASSNLIIGNSYKLKIVIGDYLDSSFDSAIFMKSSLLDTNILGADLTIENNTAVCQGSNVTLATGLSTSNYTFLWKKDGIVFPSQTNSSLVVDQAGTYTVDVTNNTTLLLVSDTVIVEFYEQLQINQPQNLIINETNTDGYAVFDLTSQIPLILNGLSQDDYEVNFYESLSDAIIGFNPITDPVNFTNISNPQNIYVRVESYISGCVGITSFSIEVLDVLLAVTDFDMKNIRISPNPIIDFMTVSANENINSIAIFNTLGQLVFEKKVNTSEEKIDLTALISGNYIVKITSETSSKVLKIIKQ